MKKPATRFILLFSALLCFSACQGEIEETIDETGTSLTVGNEIITSQLMDYSELLGCSENDLITQKGQGEARIDGDGNIASRSYDENVLGFMGNVYYIFQREEEERVIREIMVVFRGVTFNDAVTGISQQLGDAASVNHRENTADAYWNCFDCRYHLAKYENALMLSVARKVD